jgi:hypothetical protein
MKLISIKNNNKNLLFSKRINNSFSAKNKARTNKNSYNKEKLIEEPACPLNLS